MYKELQRIGEVYGRRMKQIGQKESEEIREPVGITVRIKEPKNGVKPCK